MKHFIPALVYILILIFVQSMAFGQNKLVKDLDNDKIKDTVFIDIDSSRIVCRLSTQNFRKIRSRVIEILNDESGITLTRSGFSFYNNWMRAGYRNQFRYEAKSKRIRLIGMSRYEFGNAVNDGSGESSINLLTGDYVGNWNFYDEDKQELISIPTIKTKMHIPVTYLEFFNDETYFNYAGKCADLYERHKRISKL
jgi:hypothetical protein